MHEAAVHLGKPWHVIRAAKNSGAPGFKNSRVNITALAAWFEERDSQPAAPLQSPAPTEPAERDLVAEVRDVEEMLAESDKTAKSLIRSGQFEMAKAFLDASNQLATRRNAALVQLRRQGKTDDDSIPRPEVERVAYALAFAARLGIERASDEAADKLRGVTDPVEIRRILSGIMCAEVYLAPFRQAVNLDAGHGLPHWVVEAMNKAAGEMVEEQAA